MPTYTQYRRGSHPSGAADTTAVPSANIWAPVQEKILTNDGVHFWDDFATFLDGTAWDSDNATAGTAAILADGVGGILALDSASATADQGIQIQANGASFTPTADTKIYFECRLSISDGINGAQFFAGLSAVDTTIFASGANSVANHMGYEMNALTQAGTVGTASTANFYGEKAGTRNTAAANVGLDVHLFVDGGVTDGQSSVHTAGWVKLGFIVDGVTEIQCYVDGKNTLDVIPTANVPIVGLAPSFACLSEGVSSQDPVCQVDWVKVFQTTRSA